MTLGYELYHLGYRPDDIAGLNRTTDGHGPLEDTGERNDFGPLMLCNNCGWTGAYTDIIVLSAKEKRRPLEARNRWLLGEMNRKTADDPGGLKKALVESDKMEFNANAAEIVRLQALDDDAHVGFKFKGTHHGGMDIRIVTLPDPEPEVEVVIATQEPPAPPVVTGREVAEPEVVVAKNIHPTTGDEIGPGHPDWNKRFKRPKTPGELTRDVKFAASRKKSKEDATAAAPAPV